MATDVVVPEVGEVSMELTLAGWLKAEGELVEAGEPLFELDTGKATIEIEALAGGTLAGVVARTGDIVKPRQVVARILGQGELDYALTTPAAPEAGSMSSDSAPAGPDDHDDPSTRGSPPISSAPPLGSASTAASASPKARRLAASEGIDLAMVKGTGPDGLITEQDVQTAIADGAPGNTGRPGGNSE